jgi:acetylglutamate kinase
MKNGVYARTFTKKQTGFLRSIGIPPEEAAYFLYFFDRNDPEEGGRRPDGGVVVKAGGEIVEKEEYLKPLAEDIVFLQQSQVDVALVHGGGGLIDRYLKDAGIPFDKKDGVRVTEKRAVCPEYDGDNPPVAEALDEVRGKISLSIERYGGNATELTRVTAAEMGDPELGYVGTDIFAMDGSIEGSVREGRIAVISPLALNYADPKEWLNVNADLTAAHVAKKLLPDRVVYMTDVPGIHLKDGEKLNVIKRESLGWLIMNEDVQGGMTEKAKRFTETLGPDLRALSVLDGREEHILLQELLTAKGAAGKSTMIVY